ncbi:MAG: HDOD domain-containing protein [Phycisphaerales bacterium]
MKVRQELSAREVEQLHEQLMRRLGDTSVPSLPQVAVKIIELIGNQNATINQFAEVIKADQALTGRLLRLANSAMFAQRQPVTTLQRAMVLMGMERLKAMALGFHLSKAMVADEGPFSLKRLWTQALFRAWLALHIAETLDKRISGEAFIVGLLSDSGSAVMTKLLGNEYVSAVNPSDPPQKQFLNEMRLLPYTHVDASLVLTKVWKLPALLAKPIGSHHSPTAPASADNPASILGAVAYYVGSMPLDPNGVAPPGVPLPELADKLFGLSHDEMLALIAKSGESFKQTREMFAHMLDSQLSVDRIVDQANMHAVGHDSAVEDMKDVEFDAAGTFKAGGLVFELRKGPEKHVTAYISDGAGNRIVQEEIDPRKDNEKSIRAKLLLDDAAADDVKKLMTGIRALAA